jgi:hypothetical protein
MSPGTSLDAPVRRTPVAPAFNLDRRRYVVATVPA